MTKLAPLEPSCGHLDGRTGTVIGIFLYLLGGYESLFFCLFVYVIASAVKEKYDIHEHVAFTCLKSICCSCCFLIQMHNESVDIDGEAVPAVKLQEESAMESDEDLDDESSVRDIKKSATFILEEETKQGVRNHQFAQWLEEDRRHTINCKTLPLTMATWFVFIFVMWCHGNIDDTFRMQECLKSAINEVKARHSVSGIGQSVKSTVTLETVSSVEEMWSWIEAGLVPAMAGSPMKPGFVRTYNQVIGQIQLREERFDPGECQVGEELANYYRQGCHTPAAISSAPYGVQTGNLTDKAFLPGYGLGGELSEFNAKRFFSWLDIQRPTLGKARANELRTAKWIDDGSKSLEVNIVLFNPEIQAYGYISVKLMLKRGGLIKVDLDVRTLWATMYTKWYMLVADILWVLFVMKFIANSVQKAVDNRVENRGNPNCIKSCCKLPKRAGGGWWLAIDWLGILLALFVMSFVLVLSSGCQALAQKVGKLGIGPEPMLGNETVAEMMSWEQSYGVYYANNAEVIEDIENLMFMKVLWRLGQFWYCMVFLLRWFKGFRGQARIAQITSTLSSAFADLVHFAIIFSVLFVNFGLSAHVLFGSEVSEWSSITKALQSSMAMAYGKVNFAPMHEIAPYSALIWLALYVISIVMLSMNMLLSIIADHYGGVFHENNAGDKGYDIFTQTYAMIYEAWWNSSYVARWVYRIVYQMFPKRVKGFRWTPQFPEEEVRRDIPYEELYWTCEMDPLGFTTVRTLRRAGCDRATAKHLLKRCEDEVLRHLEEEYPLELLFDEFDESMQQYYFAMDTFSNELRSWFGEKTQGANRMVPRQHKLDELSKELQVAEKIEHVHHHHHSAATLEGEGHHHHHHRRHHEDGQSHSQSNSEINSRTQSRQLSRSQSRADSG